MRAILFGIIIVVGGCSSKDAKDEFMSKSKPVEAELNLKSIEKGLKAHQAEQSMFPSGSVPLTPATPCCEAPNKKCPADPAQWAGNPVWEALDFSVDEPGFFQYSYESDGKKAKVSAVGDVDCDGTTVTYEVTCETVEGNPACTHTSPANAD